DRTVTGVQTCALPISRTRRLVSREQFAAAFDERFGGARVLQLRERAHGAHAHARVGVRRRVQGERVEGRGVFGGSERASGVRARSEERRGGEGGMARW